MRFAAERSMRRAFCRCRTPARRHCAVLRLHLGGSSRGSLRHRSQYPDHASQIARDHRQLEVLIDPLDAAIDRLPNPTDGLAPAEMLLDALADHLTDPVARVPRRAPIDCAAALALIVARHVRRLLASTAFAHELARVVSLVGSHGLGMSARHTIEQAQGTRAFAKTIGVADYGAHHQARAVLHQ